jgi:Holliday junction resolvase
MGAKSKRKGYAFEHAVSVFLKGRGWHCTRHYQRIQNNDTPDLTATWEKESAFRIVRIECKNQKTMPAKCDSAALDQALGSAGPGIAVACIKREGSGTQESVVLLRLEDFVRLVEG